MNILIIGGTGSLGQSLTKYYLDQDWGVTVFSRDAIRQATMQQKYPQADYILGDILDYDSVEYACENMYRVVNCAALKHVGLGESNVETYFDVNTRGAINVVKACRKTLVPQSLFISSDKACEPINVYGQTKALGESVYRTYGYSALRYGNVVTSRGSFLHVFKEKASKGLPITIREPIPTRFYLSLYQAVRLVENAFALMSDGLEGSLLVPHSLQSFNIQDVALQYSNSLKYSKLLPGEKQHEKLLSQHEQGEVVSDLLCSVWKGHEGWLDHEFFDSSTSTLKMTGEQFLEKVKT